MFTKVTALSLSLITPCILAQDQEDRRKGLSSIPTTISRPTPSTISVAPRPAPPTISAPPLQATPGWYDWIYEPGVKADARHELEPVYRQLDLALRNFAAMRPVVFMELASDLFQSVAGLRVNAVQLPDSPASAEDGWVAQATTLRARINALADQITAIRAKHNLEFTIGPAKKPIDLKPFFSEADAKRFFEVNKQPIEARPLMSDDSIARDGKPECLQELQDLEKGLAEIDKVDRDTIAASRRIIRNNKNDEAIVSANQELIETTLRSNADMHKTQTSLVENTLKGYGCLHLLNKTKMLATSNVK